MLFRSSLVQCDKWVVSSSQQKGNELMTQDKFYCTLTACTRLHCHYNISVTFNMSYCHCPTCQTPLHSCTPAHLSTLSLSSTPQHSLQLTSPQLSSGQLKELMTQSSSLSNSPQLSSAQLFLSSSPHLSSALSFASS